MTIPKGGMPKTFPRGELLNEMERNGQVERTYSFNPEKVLAWLIHNGLIEMERTNDTTLSFKVPNARDQPPTRSKETLETEPQREACGSAGLAGWAINGD